MTASEKPPKRAAKKTVDRPPARSVTERVAALRARKAAAGHAEVRGVFAHLEDHSEIKREAARIVRRREQVSKRAA